MPPAVSPFQSHLAPQSQQQQHLQQQHQMQHQQQQHQQQQNIPPPNAFFPSLHLYPLNDSFVPKQIALAPQNGRVKIGRQTNAKTVPGERNGYFDSKVLSRQHAEIWEEGGKIYIKDVKSSNGTFINGERLSPEGVESEPFELKSDDTVEFGIDIVGEDNKTIIHHKVAAKVFCIFTHEDLQSLPMHQQQGGNRRPSLQSQLQAASQVQNSALGGMGAPRAGKSGLTFDHILSRLQTELAKSRETGSELNQLTGTMVDIQDTLGGSLPSNLPPYPSNLPPVRPPADPSTTSQSQSTNDAAALTALQTQLHDTQNTLQSHLDKIRHLEGYVAEQEALKRDISHMKEQIDERKREVEILLMQRQSEPEDDHRFSRKRSEPHHPEQQQSGESSSAMDMDEDSDDDDARSVATAVPEDRDYLGRGNDSEDERDLEERRERRHTDEFGRPRTPEPTGHMSDEDYEDERRMAEQSQQDQSFRDFSNAVSSASSEPTTSAQTTESSEPPSGPSQSHADLTEIFNQNAMLTSRLEALTAQLDSAMELSRTLQSQAMMAQSTIAVLESKVGTLETFVNEQQREKAASPTGTSAAVIEAVLAEDDESRTPEPPASKESTEAEAVIAQSKWDEWRERVEGGWRGERETWNAERQRLASAVKEWEIRTVELERKEGERREKEEAASERARRQQHSTGFDSPSSDDDDEHVDVVGDSDAFRSVDKRSPGLINGFTSPKKIGAKTNGGGVRRRKSHGKPNGIINGVLPSPVSSPSSSISSAYAAEQQRRGCESPTSDHHPLGVMNGKLPISPPNTSPPRSIARGTGDEDVNDEDDDTEEHVGDGDSSLGLVNGHVSSSQSSLPSSAANTDGGKEANQSRHPFQLSAQAFADRNGVGGNGNQMFAQMFASDYVSKLLSLSFLAWTFMAGASLLFIWTIADVLLLSFFPSFPLVTHDHPMILDLSTILLSHSESLQPLPYISAASMVVIGAAVWAVVNRERMGA
ncbi:hypothetical protein FRB94_000409 [Tulasnella sp. JGI-2019a]|nr:hypothetical protein FRB94_000409 [Tulasnella sp. JGI-2019a]